MALIAPKPWPIPINTQSCMITAGVMYSASIKGTEINSLICEAYDLIHKYENFYGDTNMRSECNDRLDRVRNLVILQWPKYQGMTGQSTLTGSLIYGSKEDYSLKSKNPWYKPIEELAKAIAWNLGLYKIS